MGKKVKGKHSSSSVKGRRIAMLTRTRSASIVHPGSESDMSMALLKEDSHSGDHFLTPAQLQVVYRTNVITGLPEAFAQELFDINGPNTLKEFTPPNYTRIFMRNLFGWYQCILWLSAVLTLSAYFVIEFVEPEMSTTHTPEEYIYIACVIALTVLTIGMYCFIQEAKHAMVISSFEKMVPSNTFVIRDGERKLIANANVVVGDIVEMHAGHVVPADVRLLNCNNFATDKSALSGVSIPVHHLVQCTHVNPIESRNMCFFGSSVLDGNARGVVIATGENTQIGKIAGLVTGLDKEKTPLAKELAHFIKISSSAAFIFGFLFFTTIFSTGNNIVLAFEYMLGIILSNVPEGLIITITVCMKSATRRLKGNSCITKTMQAVESLGSTTCICTDKTGTLTRNLITVSHLMANYEIYDKNDHRVAYKKAFGKLAFVASLSLKAFFADDNEVIEKRNVTGNPSEAAVLRYMEAYRSATRTQQENPKVADAPFNSEIKYSLTIHQWTDQNVNLLIIKGAPEKVLEYCTSIETDSQDDDFMTPQLNKQLKSIFAKLAYMGEQVLAYASRQLPISEFPIGFEFNTQERNFPVSDMKFNGLISLLDPPRENIDKYILMCRQAGIKVTMVTGDHPMTALAIARKCGTVTMPTAYDYAYDNHIDVSDVPQSMKRLFKAAVIIGDELRRMTPYELRVAQSFYEELTFARTTPQQKLFIVENYQALDHIVVVTGDGLNDAPALKRANVGIAMGVTGTEISKAAADMILLDDNFQSIVHGIEEGRRIFDNLKKAIAYTLTSNTPEMMPFIMQACFDIPLPITLMMIILINVGTNLLPAMSLAYEFPEEDIMTRPPRGVGDHLVSGRLVYMAYIQIGLIEFCAGMFAYLVTFAKNGFFPSSLMFVRDQWDEVEGAVTDTLGRLRSYDDRKKVERMSQTSYFIAICLTQVSNLIICKTKKVSLWRKGMRNKVLNISILVTFLVIFIVTYIPVCNDFFGTEPVDVSDLFLAAPFMILMIMTDEMRRYIIINNLIDWVEKETCY